MISTITPRLTNAARVSSLPRIQIVAWFNASQSQLLTHHNRYFSASARRGEEASDASSISDFVQKIKNSPKAKDSVQSFMDLLKEKGVDLSSGEKPSVTQIAKLMMQSDVRAKSTEVIESLKQVGVDVSPTQWSSLLGKMGASSKEGGK